MFEVKHNYGRDRLKWKKNKMYFGEKLMAEIIPHEKFPKCYHMKFCWRDEKTPEFVNGHWAKEYCMKFALLRLNYEVWERHLPASLMSLNDEDVDM